MRAYAATYQVNVVGLQFSEAGVDRGVKAFAAVAHEVGHNLLITLARAEVCGVFGGKDCDTSE